MKILVTAGPTREHLDPVRFLSNRSTGKMGFAVAAAAAAAGHEAVLVAGPVSLATPEGVRRVDVISARDMTTEAVVTKLMWALGQTDDPDEVRRIFATCYCGEITLAPPDETR